MNTETKWVFKSRLKFRDPVPPSADDRFKANYAFKPGDIVICIKEHMGFGWDDHNETASTPIPVGTVGRVSMRMRGGCFTVKWNHESRLGWIWSFEDERTGHKVEKKS